MRPDGDYECRKREIETAAKWWDCNKTAALPRGAEAVRDLDARGRAALQGDDLTTAQKREIVKTMSGRQLTYSVQEDVDIER